MDCVFDYNLKKKLLDRISKIKDKKNLKDIKSIIFKYNSAISYVQKSDGIMLYFHNLENETYAELNEYLNKNTLNKCVNKLKKIDEIESSYNTEINGLSHSDSPTANYDSTVRKNSNQDANINKNNIFLKKKLQKKFDLKT